MFVLGSVRVAYRGIAMPLANCGGVPMVRRRSFRVQLLAGAALIVAVTLAAAQDASWTGLTGNYLSPSNWNTNLVPSGTATFGSAPTTVIQIGSPVSVGDWTFAAGAPGLYLQRVFYRQFLRGRHRGQCKYYEQHRSSVLQ